MMVMPLRLLLECENMARWRCEKGFAVGVVCEDSEVCRDRRTEGEKKRGFIGKERGGVATAGVVE